MPQVPPAPVGSLAAALMELPDPRQPYGWRPEYAPVPLVGPLQTGVAGDDPVALDGKTLRGANAAQGRDAPPVAGESVPGLHLVAAYAHRAQAVLAQLRTAGKGEELAGAKQVLAQVPLRGRVVTGDALLTQRDICAQIVAAGGDYVLPVKDNQPALRESLERAFSPLAARRP